MRHLLFFPNPYPNEDFRNVIYRYHHRSGNVEMKDTKEELFGIGSSKLGHFPRNISCLLKKLPIENRGMKKEFLSCTWFPLFKPFLEKERLSIVEKDILYGKTSPNNYVGKVAAQRNTPVLSRTIKYCLICMEKDFKRNGEVYAHLEHQVDFLDFCPTHLIKLDEKCPECNTPFSDTLKGVLSIKPCCYSNDYQNVEENKITKFKLKLFNELQFFKDHVANMKLHILYAKIIAMLGKNGYINSGGYIEKRRILEDLVKEYQLDYLRSISLNLDLFSKNSLPYLFNQKHMSNFIILYFLLIIFLEGSIKNWLNQKEYYSIPIPFGNGPWPCYNPVCPSFHLYDSIKKCKRTITGKSNIGRFVCSICGFEYTKKESSEVSDNHCSFQLEKWGFLWERKVQELYHCGYEVKEIANLTGFHISTIKNCLNKYKSILDDFIDNKGNQINNSKTDLEEEIFRGPIEVAASREIELKESYRDKIRNLKQSQENLKRMDVKKIAQKEYAWLLKNDKKWLDKVLPPMNQPLLDYKSIDADLKLKVRKTAEMLLSSNPTTRIQQYSILNKLDAKDKNRILSHKEKLPQTILELESHIESVEDYQVRHVPCLVSQLKAGGYVNVTLNSILAYRRSYRN